MAQPLFDKEAWEMFWRRWDDVTEKWPDAKRLALREMGKVILKEVVQQIPKRGVHDSRGRVARWQNMRLGSGGGYVAVSPSSEDTVQVTRGGNRTNSAQITQYLEGGHAIRPPSGRTKRYVPRLHSGRSYVPGHLFYSWAKMDVEYKAIDAADQVLDELSDTLADFFAEG